MSSVPPSWPPEPPPPPPPPGGAFPPGGGWEAPPPAAAAIPWEQPGRDLVGAFVETLKLFLLSPEQAFRRTPEKGDFGRPLLFSILVSWAGAVVSGVWSLVIGNPWQGFLPAEMREQMAGAFAVSAGAVLIQVAVAPVVLVIVLFVWTAILHLCLLIVGATKTSTAGFEGTFRVCAYSGVADLANAVPFVGPLAAGIWKIVLSVIGVVALHRTTSGKAIVAILIPILFCCVCAVAAALVMGAAIFGALNR